MTNKKNRFFTLVFSCCPARGRCTWAVSAGVQPDGSVFWYDCLSGMVGL